VFNTVQLVDLSEKVVAAEEGGLPDDTPQLPQGKVHKSQVGEPKPASGTSLASYWVRGFLGVALVLVLATLAGILGLHAREQSIADQQLSAWTEATVRSVASRIATVQSLLREWANDPGLQKVLRSMDADALRAKEETLARQIPEALAVHLVTSSQTGTMDGSGSFISYASLDLMRRALQERKVSTLEVHRVAQPDMHLAIVGPVLDNQGGRALGVVHVALPLSLLHTLGETGGAAGRISFQQSVGDDVVTLSQGQTAAVPQTPPQRFTEIPGTSLRVAVWPAEIGWFDSLDAIWAALGCAISLVLAGLALWIPYRSLMRDLAADHAGLVALVGDGVAHKPLRRLKCRMAETGSVHESLYPLVMAIQTAPAARGGAPAASEEKAPDHPFELDVRETDISPSGGKVLIEEQPGDLSPSAGDSDKPTAKTWRAAPDAAHLDIFRAYDVRGVVDHGIDDGVMGSIGQAVASEAAGLGDRSVIVARDTRESSSALTQALIAGVRAGGCNVFDLGIAPTPLLYFATRYQGDTSGVMVTASHNPPQYNGCKIVLAGQSIDGDRMQVIEQRVIRGDLLMRPGGGYQTQDLAETYIEHVKQDVAISRGLKLVIDCGNGSASLLAPDLYRALGCEVIELHCDPEGGFPDGRVSDPSRSENLFDLIEAVTGVGADLGLGFDGDGDRLGVVDSDGRFIAMDRIMMLFAADVLSRHPGTDIIFDVKSTHLLAAEIMRCGGRPVMSPSGHSRLKAKMRESSALLAGELSGHVIFRERWYGFDDALYAGARLIELLALDPRTTAEVFATLPEAISTPELLLPLQEGESQQIVKRILGLANRLEGVSINRVDGLRAEFDGGWGLVRASNTQPALSFRFQGNDRESLKMIQGLFRRMMEHAAPGLDLPF
jgi:phosphomannomutase / phosphoglucomutase